MIAAVQQQQSDSNSLSPTSQQKVISRAPSPVPSAVYSSSNHQVLNNSSPKLPLPHRSSFSTDTDVYEEKSLITQKSYPHFPTSKKHRKKQQRGSRRGSDATTTSTATDDNLNFSYSQGGAGGQSMTNLSTITTTITTMFANEKRNHDFHTLFRSVPENERLIDDYGCALQKEILLQGRVYISEQHLCFNANIFGWITNLVIAFADIEEIEKRSTAIFIPNAILISTCSSKHFLASFLSRDQAYDQMLEIWKSCRASASQIEVHHHDKFNDDATAYSDEESDLTTSSDYSYTDEDDEENSLGEVEREEAADQVNGIIPDGQDKTMGDRQGSLASLPLPKHLSNDSAEAARRRAVSEAGPRPNMQDYLKSHKSETNTSALNNQNDSVSPTAAETETIQETEAPQQIKEKTDCECSKNDQHFPTIVMDNKYDTTIESMYNILFNSSFMNKFLCEVEKSTEVCIGEWCRGKETVYSRESSYIKFLGGSIGPKSTKCHLKEDVLHYDTSDYISQLTVTQTPDVPSGGSFSVKTRTCISWCGQGQVRVLVTVLVDFTKSSWLKSTIEKASIDGQQNYYKSLDAAVRKYLDQQKAASANGGKKKSSKRGRRHRHHKEKESQADQSPAVQQPETQQHVVVQVISSILNWCIENASMPNISQLTAFCMGLMVITNIYIASKMAGVDKQLIQLGGQVGTGASAQQSEHYYQKEIVDDNNSLWKLLSKLDPDARKEDLKFVHHTRPSVHDQSKQYQNRNKEEEQVDIYDENLESSQMAKNKLDKQMMELEKMIQKAGQSMKQVTQVVKNQRQRILNPEWK